MVFSSVVFLFLFLPIVLAVYYIIKANYRNYWLLFVSIIFFAWSQPEYLWILVLNIFINYTFALLISNYVKHKKIIIILAVIANLLLLFYFKYFDFTIDSINKVIGKTFEIKNIILPIGISFFTFQGMSYVIDVYRGDVKSQKNPIKLALYIALFPQLIAGPIVRYKQIESEIDCRKIVIDDLCEGIERFIIGIAKKAIIANTMAEIVDGIWNQGAGFNTCIMAWIGSLAYMLQIYYDFSGYSDMAIGLGRMFGFHFDENFNLPYTANSISEFWRRWHISLSSWFRDYVYIPLGGNKKNVYLNLAIVFVLTGMWHGASWHFVAWGIWNGIFILLERFLGINKKKTKNGLETILFKAYTLLVVNLGWIIFRADGLHDAYLYVLNMLGKAANGNPGYTLFWYIDRWTVTIMVIGVIFASSIPSKAKCWLSSKVNGELLCSFKYICLLLIFYLSILRIVSGTYNPFIYFQF